MLLFLLLLLLLLLVQLCVTFRMSTITGLDYWTLDWTTGLTQPAKYNSFSAEQKLYFLSYFTNTAPYSVFPGVSRGQKSHAYLISFTFGGYA